MSAIPIVTASLQPSVPEGLVLYQNQTVELNLNDVVRTSFLGAVVTPSPMRDDGVHYIYDRLIRITAASPPAGLTASSGYSLQYSALLGTPTTIAATSLLCKVEVYNYRIPISSGSPTSTVLGTGYISIPINVIAVPTSITPPASEPVILAPSTLYFVKGSYVSFPLENAVTVSPMYITATGLPPGMHIYNESIAGTPTTAGTSSVVLSLRYKPSNDEGFVTETKTISVIVNAAEVSTPSGISFLGSGGIDVFLDLQSMALSLDLPKTEAVIPADSTVINATAKSFVVKPDQILDLNVRFTKGSAIVDPDPASMRFGIGSKIGGPLLMLGSAFTKVGTGSSAYFKMRVVSDAGEFSALESDYYDEDAAEQIAQTEDKQAGGTEPLDGICELEFTTGAGGTLATFRSDNLPVLIRRSLLAGI